MNDNQSGYGRFRGKLPWLVGGLLICALVTGLILSKSSKKSELAKPQALTSAFSAKELTAGQGSRLSDLPPADQTKRTEFMQQAAQTFDIPPRQQPATAELLVIACIEQKKNLIQATARSDSGYGNNLEALKRDHSNLHTYCYETYSADGKVPSEPEIKHGH